MTPVEQILQMIEGVDDVRHCPFCKKKPKVCTHIEGIGAYIIHDMNDQDQLLCILSKTSFSFDEWQSGKREIDDSVSFSEIMGIFKDK